MTYNEYLTDKESPLIREGFTSALDFDVLTDRNIITQNKLSSDAVGSSSIEDLSVTTSKIANSAVTAAKIASGAVQQTEIAGTVIQGTHISSDQIAGTHISSNQIAGTHIVGSAIYGTHIHDYDLAIGTGDTVTVGGTTNYARLDGTYGIRLYGSATVWDDQMIDIGRVRTGPIGTAPTWGTMNGCEVLLFNDGTINSISFTTQFPHRAKVGGDVEYHIHTSPSGTHTGTILWEFTHSWTKINGTFPAVGTLLGTQVINGEQDKHMLFSFGTIGTNYGISSMILCTLARNGTATGDSFGTAIRFLQSDFHYEIDSVGSDGTTSKS